MGRCRRGSKAEGVVALWGCANYLIWLFNVGSYCVSKGIISSSMFKTCQRWKCCNHIETSQIGKFNFSETAEIYESQNILNFKKTYRSTDA